MGEIFELELETGEVVQIDLAAMSRLSAGEQAKAAMELRALEQKLLHNPMLRYKPASCQPVYGPSGEILLGHAPGTPCTPKCKHADFHRAQHPLKAFFGGNRAGKTTTAIVDDIIQVTPRELLPPRLHEFKQWECPFYCRVIAPDMQRTMVPVIYQKLRDWLPKELLKNGSFDSAFDKSANSLRLECGCRFDFLSYEMDLNKFGGAALHRVHYDEEPPGGIRRECLMRLIDYNGQEILSMTPLNGITWTFREVWKSDDPNIYKTLVSMGENPTLSAEARTRILNSVTNEGERAAREHGHFIDASGLVYPGWMKWVVPARPPSWVQRQEIVVSMDPGVRFFGIVAIAFERDTNKSFTFAAEKLTNATAEEAAHWVRRLVKDWGLKANDIHFTIDPAARQRNAVNSETVMSELARFDIFCNPAQNDVEAGVGQIRRRGLHSHVEISDGPETDDLRDELMEYALDIDPNVDDGLFKVKKQNDHCCDAWRYGHMERPWLPEDAGPAPDPSDKLPWWAVAGPPSRRRQDSEYGTSMAGAMV